MPSPAPSVRLATDADRPALTAMIRLFHAGEDRRTTRERAEAALAALLADDRLGHVLVAEAGGEPLGYAVVGFGFDLALGGRDALLAELYVRPAARRRGLGALLVADAERRALGTGARQLRLALLPENEPAFTLFRGRGFEPLPRVLLAKPLTDDPIHEPR